MRRLGGPHFSSSPGCPPSSSLCALLLQNMMGVPSASTSPQHHVLEMPPLRCDVPFLVRYGSGGFQGPPTNGIPCPEQLVKLCAANGLFVRQTVTDGNCGLDAFEQALCSLPKERARNNHAEMRGLAKAGPSYPAIAGSCESL